MKRLLAASAALIALGATTAMAQSVGGGAASPAGGVSAGVDPGGSIASPAGASGATTTAGASASALTDATGAPGPNSPVTGSTSEDVSRSRDIAAPARTGPETPTGAPAGLDASEVPSSIGPAPPDYPVCRTRSQDRCRQPGAMSRSTGGASANVAGAVNP